MSDYFSYRIESLLDTVPEKKKLEPEYLKGNIDKAINDLVYYKYDTRIAYQTYYGERDYTEYQHLVDNHGVNSPVDIPRMRLMGSRIDYLIGKSMQNRFDYFVTCSNTEAIDLKNSEKRTKILSKIQSRLKHHNDKIKNILSSGEKEESPVAFTEDFYNELKEDYGESWQSSFETAAQDMITMLIDELALMEKAKDHMKDFLTAGEMYNRVFVEEKGKHPSYWHCDPRDTFPEYNPNSPWIKDCRRIVHRMYLHPTQVLHKFGHLMSEEDRNRIARAIGTFYDTSTSREVLHYDDPRRNEEVALSDRPFYHHDLVEVFHVEWVATNLVDGDTDSVDSVEVKNKNIKSKGKRLRMDRYEGYKISQMSNIYFGMGKSKYIERSVARPYECSLTYNGRWLKNPRVDGYRRDSETGVNIRPFSFITATKDISDIYDITTMQLNQLMAAARPGGTIEPLENLPKVFGNSAEERLKKSAGYEKAFSKKLVQLSQEGAMPGEPGAIPFNNYGSYPANVDGNLIQAYTQYMEILEQQADRMLGLNSRMRGEMEQRDGKAATINAVQQGDLFTKEMFRMHSAFIRETLTRLLNATRVSYPDGFMGSVVLGKREKQFLIDPRTHSISDYNVYVSDDIDEKEQQQKADELITLAVQNQVADLKLAFDTVSSNSISQKKAAVEKAYKRQEKSAKQQLEQLQQQLEQLQKENEKLQKEYEKAESKVDQYKTKELELKEKETNSEIKERETELELEREKIENKRKEVEMKIKAELAQLEDNNKKNDEINWNR